MPCCCVAARSAACTTAGLSKTVAWPRRCVCLFTTALSNMPGPPATSTTDLSRQAASERSTSCGYNPREKRSSKCWQDQRTRVSRNIRPKVIWFFLTQGATRIFRHLVSNGGLLVKTQCRCLPTFSVNLTPDGGTSLLYLQTYKSMEPGKKLVCNLSSPLPGC